MRLTRSKMVAFGLVIVIVATIAYRYVSNVPSAATLAVARGGPSAPKQVVAPARVAAQMRVASGNDAKQVSVDWTREFEETTDIRATMLRVGDAALKGDGRAALAMASNQLRCVEFQINPKHPHTVQELYEQSQDPRANEQYRAQARRDFPLCQSYIKDGPPTFPDLPTGFGGQEWLEVAYRDREPEGIWYHDQMVLSQSKATPAEVAAAQADVDELVTSGDPHAMLYAAQILNSGLRDAENSIGGAALRLAVCRLGYDCGMERPQTGEMLYQDFLSTFAPSSIYARIDARAQAIVDAYNLHDMAAVKALTKVDTAGYVTQEKIDAVNAALANE